jgi:hypothetical protein
MVATKSMSTMNPIYKQQNLQSWSKKMSSPRLWMVELIQRRHYDMSTLHSSGATVYAIVFRTN